MEDKKIKKCSLCDVVGHNIRTCPLKPIDDTFVRDDYIHEEVVINPKKEIFIKDLLDRDAYDISKDLFRYWLKLGRPIQLKELKYVMDRGLSNDSIKLYIELANDIDELY